mmetsp:Transcript_12383/g.41928  ORF Transcript_12383/g.41928 Transcript_12383/m.41928 type:complete len:87 (-) Transcript_12383:364-624(-)
MAAPQPTPPSRARIAIDAARRLSLRNPTKAGDSTWTDAALAAVVAAIAVYGAAAAVRRLLAPELASDLPSVQVPQYPGSFQGERLF